jgi:hypothetical protein
VTPAPEPREQFTVQRHRAIDIDHLRRLATRLFTDGQFRDADMVLAELADVSEGDRPQIALRRAQIGMLGDRMTDVGEQLEIARDAYGRHVYFVGLLADMAVRKGDLPAAAEALRQLGRLARAEHLEGFGEDWYRVTHLSSEAVTWDDSHALPLFDVVVNGQAGRFVLDTGTGDCLLDSAFAQRAGVQPGPHDQARFAGGRVGHWQLARIDSLSVGASRFARLPAMTAPLANAFSHFAGATVDGIIGAGLLRAAGGVDIAYSKSRFRLGAPGVDEGVPLWIAGSHYPLTSCQANGGRSSCWFIDSGMSGIELACSASAARRHGAQALNRVVEAKGGGGALSARVVRIRFFRHAGLEYPELPAAILPGFTLGRELGIRIGGIVGHAWLARHRVRLDYRNMLTAVSPAI